MKWWWKHGDVHPMGSETLKKRHPLNQLNTFPKISNPNQPTGPRCFHQGHAGLVREEAIEFRRPILHLLATHQLHGSSRGRLFYTYKPVAAQAVE